MNRLEISLEKNLRLLFWFMIRVGYCFRFIQVLFDFTGFSVPGYSGLVFWFILVIVLFSSSGLFGYCFSLCSRNC